MSRAREAMHLCTDSKVALREAVTRPSSRLSPLELINSQEIGLLQGVSKYLRSFRNRARTPKGPGTRDGTMNKAERERYEIALYRYKRRFPLIVLSIFAPCLCLSALAWLIPCIGRSFWTEHSGDASAYIWLVLVVIGVAWQLYALVATVRYLIDFVRLVCARPMNQTQKRQRGMER
jgi:hypothetical protein